VVQILCTHVCEWKNEPAETIPEVGIGVYRRIMGE
jgi:hypothetical protein